MFRIAAVQMTSSCQKAANLAQTRASIEEAARRGCDLVAFPENFTVFMDSADDTLREAETANGLTLQSLREWAIENEIWILAGSLPLKTSNPKKITNTSFLISPDGKLVSRYDKIHLFDVVVNEDRSYKESKTVQPGKKISVVKTPLGHFGFSICYDLRFPELYRKLSQKGAQVIFIPAAFTFKTGQAHWDMLTRTRAVENQTFVVAPAQWGKHENGRETWGHTRIIDPWGRILAERMAGPGLAIADLDFEVLKKVRADFPALTHRRMK